MNNFKNFVIVVLSFIILVQAGFLFRLMHRAGAVPKKTEIKAPVIKPVITQRPVQKKEREENKEIVGRIAIVLDDWGYHLKNKDFLVENDYHVTISILPFRAYSAHIAQLCYQKNKDVIIHMPMEPLHRENYGLEENTLLTTMDKKTITRLLSSAFDSVPFAKGLSNHMGSKATEDVRLMEVVLGYLKEKDLFFLDSFVTPKTVCRRLATNIQVGFFQRDVFIDNKEDPDYIKGQLLQLAQKARRVGVAIGIGHDRSATIAVLKEMIPRLQEEGYRFVNLSEIAYE